MDQFTHDQTPALTHAQTPAAASAAARAESVNAAIRSRVFGPNHERLSSLTKLHILASDSSFNSDIFWMDDGKSFAIDRVGYQRNIMNVFFDQSKFKSLQNLLSRYRFKAVQTINDFTGGTTHEFIIYSHPLFIRGHLDIVNMIQLSGRGATAQTSKMIAKRSETRPNDKKTISSFGAAEGHLQVLGAEINDSAAEDLVSKNAAFEDNFDDDATLTESKQWLPSFHDLHVDITTNAVIKDYIDNDAILMDSTLWQQLLHALDVDITTFSPTDTQE